MILGFVTRLCNDPYLRFATHKKVKRVTIRRAGRPDLLLLNLLNAIRPAWTRPASSCFHSQGCHRHRDLMVIFRAAIKVHPTTPFSHRFVKFFLPSLTVFLLIVSKSYSFLSWYIRRKVRRLSQLLCLLVDSPLPECDYLFLFMFQQTAETVLRKKINKKDYFLMRRWSIESVPEI